MNTQTITLSQFTTGSGQRRIYVNGTTRSKIYFTEATDGTMEGMSDAIRPQPNTSSLSQRREKDRAALTEARKAARAILGGEGTLQFESVWGIAR